MRRAPLLKFALFGFGFRNKSACGVRSGWFLRAKTMRRSVLGEWAVSCRLFLGSAKCEKQVQDTVHK